MREREREGEIVYIGTMSVDMRRICEIEHHSPSSVPLAIAISSFFYRSRKSAVVRNFVYRRLTFVPQTSCRFCSRCTLAKANREKRYCSTRSRLGNTSGFIKENKRQRARTWRHIARDRSSEPPRVGLAVFLFCFYNVFPLLSPITRSP